MSSGVSAPTVTVTFVYGADLKPVGGRVLTVYLPGGSKMIRYAPSVSDPTLFEKPVSWFVAVTRTPGTAAPFGSTTRPSMLPLFACDCASAQLETEMIRAVSTRSLLKGLKLGCISSPLLDLLSVRELAGLTRYEFMAS